MAEVARMLLLLLLLLPLLLSFQETVRGAEDICRGTHCYGGDTADPRPCTGAHCPDDKSSRPPRQSAPAVHLGAKEHRAYPAVRTLDAAVPAGCADAECAAPSRQHTNDTQRNCRGIECRLPLKIRPAARGTKPCVGETCPPAAEEPLPPLRLSDRAAQFLGDIPEFGSPPSELGGAPLGVQLTCDVKPGENEVPSEDALILHLQLAKGQEKLVEALRSQQLMIRDLQQKLGDQQEALLSQQRRILEQQRHMYEQMDAVKAQYELLADTLKQLSFRGLQGELQSYFQSQLAGLQSQARGHLHRSVAVDKTDVDAEPTGCSVPCGAQEFCDFQREPPRCRSCTMCPPGFFLISRCSPRADTMCQDRDECLELPSVCGERVKCLNTPGGFRCLGASEREAESGLCGPDYYYNAELQECQACSDCDGERAAAPCSPLSDAVCTQPADARLSQSWHAGVTLPSARSSGGHVFPGLRLNLRGGESGRLLAERTGRLTFLQHGLLWLDHNFAVKHGCRNFLQVGMRLEGGAEEGEAAEEEERWDLSGARLEQPEGKSFQSVSVSGGVEVEPNDTLSLLLRSPDQHCNLSHHLQLYHVATPTFSLLWLSHDTGAVAMTADVSQPAHYQSGYRPAFRLTSVSDPYVVGLTHDGRGVRFAESGAVKFVLQQALYAMGHACVREGFSLVAYSNRNGSAREAARAFKTGVNYRDTSVTLSGTVGVERGDTLSFQLTSPSQCNVRYFGDSSGISALSLLWIPSAVSSALAATVSGTGLPSGAVRNKPLPFRPLTADTPQVRLARAGNGFVFRERGTASVALHIKLIHSCSALKLTLQQAGGPGRGGARPAPLAQQVTGPAPEGSQWAGVGLRASFQVQNGTSVYVTLDCIRGRVNQVAHQGGTNISILWVSA